MSNEPEDARIMIFVESDAGFGHFNIIDQLLKELSGLSVSTAVVSGTFGHTGGLFELTNARRFDLPAFVSNQSSENYVCAATGLPFEQATQTRERRRQAVLQAYADFRPTLVLFEFYPFFMPFRDLDLQAVRDAFEGAADAPPLVCLCRDIIHSQDPERTVACLNTAFDYVFVRGDGVDVRLADCMEAFAQIRVPIEYVGNIAAPMPSRTPLPAGERPVLIFAGGGHRPGDPAFLEAAIAVRSHSTNLAAHPWRAFVSNNCGDAEFDHYRALGAMHGVSVERPVDHSTFKCLLADSHAAVLRGGYNTTLELIQVDVPFVVIPRESLGFNTEQRTRALLLEKVARATYMPESTMRGDDAPARIADALEQLGARAPTGTKQANDGARHAAMRLSQIGSRTSRVQADRADSAA